MTENESYIGWLYDVAYSFKDYAGEASDVTSRIRERNPGATSLLDVGCGTGKHLEHFAQEFDHVQGLDLSQALLDVAQDRLPGIPLHHGDMREFDLRRTFDAITCLFSAIGHLLTLKDLEQACMNMARHLGPDGVIIIEPWFTPDVWDADHVHMLTTEKPEVKLARACAPGTKGENNEISVLDCIYLVATPGKVETFTEHHELRMTSEAEFISALEKAGLDATYEPKGLKTLYGGPSRGLYIGIKRKW